MRRCRECFSRIEIESLSRHDLDDSFLIHLVCTEAGISSYQFVRSAMLYCNGNVFENHVNSAFTNITLGGGRMPNDWRKYAKDVLVGKAVIYYNAGEENNQAGLLA